MNDELSDDIKRKFMLPLTIELLDHKEKVFHDAPVSPTLLEHGWKPIWLWEIIYKIRPKYVERGRIIIYNWIYTAIFDVMSVLHCLNVNCLEGIGKWFYDLR